MILLLGGTHEAQALAATLDEQGLPFVVSLSGKAGASYPGQLRVGGFTPRGGLAAVLAEEGFRLVLDATHPFAAEISRRAEAAARAVGVPYIRLERPPWRAGPDDIFRDMPSLDAAAAALPSGARVFLAVGSGGLAPFLGREDVAFVLRVDPRASETPDFGGRDDIVVIRGRGPFSIETERALWHEHGFDALVTRNAGGTATAAKLAVARERRAPVYMVARPPDQPHPDAATVREALALVRRLL